MSNLQIFLALLLTLPAVTCTAMESSESTDSEKSAKEKRIEWLYITRELMEFNQGFEKQLLYPVLRKLELEKKEEQIEISTSCGNCTKANCTQMCAQCGNIYYCSKTCQKEHWVQHKLICKK